MKPQRTSLGLSIPGILLAFVVILSPLGAASHPRVTLSAPYTNTASQYVNSLQEQCKANATIQASASWNATSGVLSAADQAQATNGNCPRFGTFQYSSNSAIADSEAVVEIPFSGVYGSAVNITINLHWKETSAFKLTGTMGCKFAPLNTSAGQQTQSCIQSYYWFVGVEPEILDLTNGTTVSQDTAEWTVSNQTDFEILSTHYTNGTYLNSSTTLSCSPVFQQGPKADLRDGCATAGTLSASPSLWLSNSYTLGGKHYNDTMLKSHKYAVVLVFFENAGVDIGSSNSASTAPSGQPTVTGNLTASASTTTAGTGLGVTIKSIVL